VTIALSGALYALAFAAIGIASDYRYIFWTMLCGLITTPVIFARVIMRSDAPTLFRFCAPAIVLVIIVLREIAIHTLL